MFHCFNVNLPLHLYHQTHKTHIEIKWLYNFHVDALVYKNSVLMQSSS